MVGFQSRWATVTGDPMTSYGSMTSSGGMQMTDGRLLSMASAPWAEGMEGFGQTQTVVASFPGVEW